MLPPGATVIGASTATLSVPPASSSPRPQPFKRSLSTYSAASSRIDGSTPNTMRATLGVKFWNTPCGPFLASVLKALA